MSAFVIDRSIDRVKIFLSSSLINLLVVSRSLCTHVGGPKQFGGLWDRAPWDGGMSDHLETHCSPTCHLTKFCRHMSNRLDIGMGPKKICGRWGSASWEGAWLTPWKQAAPPHLRNHAKFGHAKVKLYQRNSGDPPENFDLSCAAFQGHSRSYGTHTDRLAIYDFLLVIHRNHGPTSYRFCDKKRWLQYSPII